MTKIGLIALGGGVGSVLRYLLAGWVQSKSGAGFPTGTLAVNVIGCLLVGILGAIFAGPYAPREEYRFLLMVGVLGGFTTFSTFGLETFSLVNGGQIFLAVMNVVLSNGVGLIGVWLGYRITERWYGA